jgi:hypothetical protein
MDERSFYRKTGKILLLTIRINNSFKTSLQVLKKLFLQGS